MWNAAATCTNRRFAFALASIGALFILTPFALAGSSADKKPPSAPPNFRLTAATQSSLTVAWDPSRDNKGGTQLSGYDVYLSGQFVARSTDNTYTYTYTGLACGTSVSVAVDAFDLSGNRSTQSTLNTSTSPCSTASPPPPPPPPPSSGDTSPPSTPSAVTVAAATATTVAVAWRASTDNVGVTGYSDYRNGALDGVTGQTSYTFSGLACGTSYNLAVDAYDAAGNHSSAASVVASTSACPDTVAPSAPTGLVVTGATTTSISVLWNPSIDNVMVAGYDAYRDGTKVGTSALTSYTFSGLTCGRSYALTVDAFDAVGNLSAPASLTATTSACPDQTAPTTPSSLTKTGSTDTSVSISWTRSTDNVAVVGYGLYRGGVSVGSSATTSATFSGLTCGTSYTFGVDAVDAAGNRSTVATLSAATAACSVPPPTSDPQPVGNPGTWRLVFDDEFSGTSLDTSKWQPNWFGPTDTSITRPVNNDDPGVLNCYDPSYVTVGGGVATIRGDSRSCTTWDGYNYPYTSGQITTRADWSFTYGHEEARVFFPGSSAPINWVGFWSNGFSWPLTGEIDVAEVLGSKICANFHYSGGQLGPDCPLSQAGWHVVAADWEPGSITYYYDGAVVARFTTGITSAPMYVLVTQDLRTNAVLPSTVQVDYVRVWQH